MLPKSEESVKLYFYIYSDLGFSKFLCKNVILGNMNYQENINCNKKTRGVEVFIFSVSLILMD